jgi:hypothetical protein
MSTASNPLVGAAWGGQAPNMFQGANPIQPPGVPQMGTGSNRGGSIGGGPGGNPGAFGNPSGSGEINKNIGIENILAAQQKNALAPQFAQLMGQYGGQAGDFFKQLMNLGSPYYQQHQQEAFTQGVNQNQNAEAMARQQLGAQGYGATPSGANAAMLGGMQMQGAQNLSEQYLQNLFANEQMQLQGAGGLSQLAGMFNPTQLLGGTSVGANIQQPSNFFQNMSSVMGGIGSMMSPMMGSK